MSDYRAKVKSSDPVISKRWAYGDKATVEGRTFIIPDDATIEDVDGEWMLRGFIEVIPASVGRSTGRNDKTAKESYGGDLIKSRHYDGIGEIVWRGNGWVVKVKGDTLLYSLNYEFTIIGTIHDKSELLQEQGK